MTFSFLVSVMLCGVFLLLRAFRLKKPPKFTA